MINKYCKNCKHLQRTAHPTPLGTYFCGEVRDLVTGGALPCFQARRHSDLCGVEARLFEEKEKKSIFDKLFRGNKK